MDGSDGWMDGWMSIHHLHLLRPLRPSRGRPSLAEALMAEGHVTSAFPPLSPDCRSTVATLPDPARPPRYKKPLGLRPNPRKRWERPHHPYLTLRSTSRQGPFGAPPKLPPPSGPFAPCGFHPSSGPNVPAIVRRKPFPGRHPLVINCRFQARSFIGIPERDRPDVHQPPQPTSAGARRSTKFSIKSVITALGDAAFSSAVFRRLAER